MGLLDPYLKYRTQTPDECWWHFAYGTRDGKNFAWYAFMQRPGSEIIESVGKVTEDAAWTMLSKYGHELTDDDRIDLELWLNSGGLDKLIAEGKIALEEERKLLVEKNTVHWLGVNLGTKK